MAVTKAGLLKYLNITPEQAEQMVASPKAAASSKYLNLSDPAVAAAYQASQYEPAPAREALHPSTSTPQAVLRDMDKQVLSEMRVLVGKREVLRNSAGEAIGAMTIYD